MEKVVSILVYAMGSQIDKVPANCRRWVSLGSVATVTTASKGNAVATSHLGGAAGERIGGAAFDIGVR
jgi:hypothetical protein